MIVFAVGDSVEIGTDDRSPLDGMVALASPCGRSLIVIFDGMLDGHVGTMPLLWSDGDDCFVALITGRPVTLTRKVLDE